MWPGSYGQQGREARLASEPPTAVANDQERNFVIKVDGGKAHWIDVKTGMTANGTVEVFGALQPGDQVIRRGTDGTVKARS